MFSTYLSRRSFAVSSLSALSALGAGTAFASQPSDAEALHVLGRIGFGPAPGEVARVRRIGVDRYIDEQLDPERLPLPE